jgi:hypothetical protein
MKQLIPFFLLLSIGVSCSDEISSEPSLFFRGGMDSVTIPTVNGSLKFEGWNSLRFHEYVSDFDFNNQGGIAYAYQEIVDNPTQAGEKVMHAVVLDDDPNASATTRAQITMTIKDGIDLDYFHSSVRMFLDDDVEHLKNYPANISWFVLFEAWTDRVSDWDGNSAGSARWNLNVAKQNGSTQLYWVAEAETMQPAAIEDEDLWSEQNKTVPIPFNTWFTLDVLIKRGAGQDGRLLIKITPDGEKTQTLFDIRNTTIYPNHPEILLNKWQPFKFYFSDTYLDWMKVEGKVLSCYYNDFKWYKK